MLSARLAAQAILANKPDPAAIWAVNIDDDYHEEIGSEEPAERNKLGAATASA
jgi:hypothetical protein